LSPKRRSGSRTSPAGGSAGAAQEPAVIERREEALDLLAQILQGTRVERFAHAEKLARDAVRLRAVLDGWIAWWRDVVLVASGSAAPLAHPQRSEALRAQAERHGVAGAESALNATCRAREQLERNASARLVVEVLMLDLPGQMKT
jgi:DNA polymerase-3 subunit delta'